MVLKWTTRTERVKELLSARVLLKRLNLQIARKSIFACKNTSLHYGSGTDVKNLNLDEFSISSSTAKWIHVSIYLTKI